MSEMHRVSDKAVKRFGNRAFGRRVDQNLRDLVGEIVTRRAVQRPIRTQFLRTGQNFLCDHVNRATIFWQRDAERLRATPLERVQIFLRQIQTIGMIDPQSGYCAASDKIDNQLVRGVEHFR